MLTCWCYISSTSTSSNWLVSLRSFSLLEFGERILNYIWFSWSLLFLLLLSSFLLSQLFKLLLGSTVPSLTSLAYSSYLRSCLWCSTLFPLLWILLSQSWHKTWSHRSHWNWAAFESHSSQTVEFSWVNIFLWWDEEILKPKLSFLIYYLLIKN